MAVVEAAGIPRGTAGFVRTQEFLSKLTFATKSIAAIRTRVNQDSQSAIGGDAPRRKTRQQLDQLSDLLGFERTLSSEKLQISGRADLIERPSRDGIRITEFKTGNSLKDGRTIDNDVLLQLLAYGLLVKERFPGLSVVLQVICSNGTWTEEFNREGQDTIERYIEGLSRRMATGLEVQAMDLATTGAHCRYCSYRPNCEVYKSWAEENWGTEEATRSLPLDSWGVVMGVKLLNDSLVEIELLRGGSDRVKIKDIPKAMLGRVPREGEAIRFFELKTREYGRGNRMPNNYFVVDRKDKWNSAFQALVT